MWLKGCWATIHSYWDRVTSAYISVILRCDTSPNADNYSEFDVLAYQSLKTTHAQVYSLVYNLKWNTSFFLTQQLIIVIHGNINEPYHICMHKTFLKFNPIWIYIYIEICANIFFKLKLVKKTIFGLQFLMFICNFSISFCTEGFT